MRKNKSQATRIHNKKTASRKRTVALQPAIHAFLGWLSKTGQILKAHLPFKILVLATLFFIGAYGLNTFSPQHRSPSTLNETDSLSSYLKRTSISLDIPAASFEDETTSLVDTTPQEVKEILVQDGDSMSLIFQRVGFGASTVHKLAYESDHGNEFSKVLPGKSFQFYFDDNDSLSKVVYSISPLERFEALYDGENFDTTHIVLEPTIFSTVRSGVINNSLFLDGIASGLSDNIIMELANIFGWDIDFALEIRQGDQFSVLFEERYLDGVYLGTGRILAAEFINQNRSIKAVRYEDKNGQASFFTPEGLSMKKAFLRTPLDVFRISSHFNLSRKHPVLNTIRAHKGTDYAASTGTPVMAAGDGKITFAGVNGGYGNMIKITHGQNYETRYAHLRNFASGIRSGKWVKQGQVIGYVGSTGLATGPHLHYEFYLNGAVRNPVTVQLPNGSPIDRSELDNFKSTTQSLLTKLEVSKESYFVKVDSPSDKDS